LSYIELISLVFSAVAAITASISLYLFFISQPRVKVVFNAGRKELKTGINEEFHTIIRIINIGNNATEVFKVVIGFSQSLKPIKCSHEKIQQIKREVKDLEIPIDVIELGRFKVLAEPRVDGSDIIFERGGLCPWNLAGKGHFDFPICGLAEKPGNHMLVVRVETAHKTFIKSLHVNTREVMCTDNPN